MLRALFLLLTLTTSANAAELTVYPKTINLTGARSAQQLLIATVVDGRLSADLTAAATVTLAREGVVEFQPGGLIRALADGETTIAVTAGRETVTVPVTVSGVKRAEAPSFRHQVLPTLMRTGCNSGACHGALAGKGGFKLSLRGYDPDTDHFVLTRQALARRVDTVDPDESLLLLKAIRAIRHGGGSRFDEDSDHYQVLRSWIAAGAPGPSPSDRELTRIELFPPAALLSPNAKMGLVVRAVYSDGQVSDVTRWAKFTSSEDQVATVDEAGQVKVLGYGAAGISAIFGTDVATITVTSPFPNQVPAETFATSPHKTFVDDHVLAKLKLLNLPPSPTCSDAEFIRRLSLDLCGMLPTVAEVDQFLADQSADKRAKLADRLLERAEYVDYWTHKWSDLLLISSRKLSAPAMWAFYRSVRQAVDENRPWDQFARDLLTASGSTLDNGLGNYFVLHKDVTDVAESTAVTFLGLSINCARCHNHPLEKWTQDQYWAFANLFARVGLKDTARPGEVVVRSLPSGESFHLRRGTPMPPAALGARPLALDSPTDRRVYLAEWLTSRDNPQFARSLVNRVWRNFMGRGLVEAEDDMRDTNPASNPELLDALARDFVEHGYDVKRLIRAIVNSAAYQRSSRPIAGNTADDRFYSRYLVRRLPAEVLLDAYSDVTAVPTPFDTVLVGSSGGTRKDASYPSGIRAVQLPDTQIISRFLDAFGRAERAQTCACERTADPTVAQALHLSNGQTLNDKLRDPRSRVSTWINTKKTDETIIDELFRIALSRLPSNSEKQRFMATLAEAARTGPDARREALEDAVWAVLTGNEFLFNH